MTMPVLSSGDFYDRQAALYEVMNDWPSRLAFELPFLRRTLEQVGARTVLDAACGGGHHALALAHEGYAAHGADLSAEMIALARHNLARHNADKAGLPVRFDQAGLADLGTHFATGSFDAALCLGNSLPHVLTEADQLAALASLRDVLRPGGVLVLQNLNYDLRWKNRPRFFAINSAALDGRPVLIWRMADYHDPGTRVPGWDGPCSEPGLITFHIATIDQDAGGAWRANVKSTLQRPLLSADLRRWLAQVGFSDIALFGGMDNQPFNAAASPDLVIVARKV